MGYAFISYSKANTDEAVEWRKFLQQNGLNTWMAPDDIPPGSKYAKVLNQAIRDCACLVLILTDDAQNSTWVSKEVERAIDYRKPIIPIQLEELDLNDEFIMYLGTDQRVTIRSADKKSDDVRRIVESIRSFCQSEGGSGSLSDPDSPDFESPVPDAEPTISEKKKLTAGLLYIFLGAVGDFYLGYTRFGILKAVLFVAALVGVLAGLSLLALGILAYSIWSLIDAILVFRGKKTDAAGNTLQAKKS